MAKFQFYASLGFVAGSLSYEIEIPDDELAACSTDEEREELIEEYGKGELANHLDWSIKPVE